MFFKFYLFLSQKVHSTAIYSFFSCVTKSLLCGKQKKKRKNLHSFVSTLEVTASINRISLPLNWFEQQQKLLGYSIYIYILMRDSYLFAFFLCAHNIGKEKSSSWRENELEARKSLERKKSDYKILLLQKFLSCCCCWWMQCTYVRENVAKLSSLKN